MKFVFTFKGAYELETITKSFNSKAEAIEWADLYIGESYGIAKA